jgi:CRP-like cAMP-binding protein
MNEVINRSDATDRSRSQLQAIEIRTYSHGEVIIREGDNPPCFFAVLSGHVRLSKAGNIILHLGDQDIFALEHLMLRKPCLYTATAVTQSRVAAYGPEALDHLIRHSPRMTLNIMTSVSRQLARLARSTAEIYDSFSLDDVEVQFFHDGETIIQEGTVGKEFYRLVSTQGGLRVSIKSKELAPIVKPGEFFGEIAGLLNLPRQATVTSMGDSVVEKYDLAELETVIRDYPEIAVQMMRTLVSRLLEVNLRLTENDI